MVTLTDRQAARMVADLERVQKATKDLKTFNTIRKTLLTLKKKIRHDNLHNRKDL